jgi:hypothetical protein
MDLEAFHLTQMSVAILAIASLMFLSVFQWMLEPETDPIMT